MFRVKRLMLASFALLLCGCATQLPDYEGASKRVALADVCQNEGYITQDQFSKYSSFQMYMHAQQWGVDNNKLEAMYFRELESLAREVSENPEKRESLKSSCSKVVSVTKRIKGDVAILYPSPFEEPFIQTTITDEDGWVISAPF